MSYCSSAEEEVEGDLAGQICRNYFFPSASDEVNSDKESLNDENMAENPQTDEPDLVELQERGWNEAIATGTITTSDSDSGSDKESLEDETMAENPQTDEPDQVEFQECVCERKQEARERQTLAWSELDERTKIYFRKLQHYWTKPLNIARSSGPVADSTYEKSQERILGK